MKTYIVKTQDLVNEHRLHHSMEVEYTTYNLEDAQRIFNAEVQQLKLEDRRAEITNPHFDFPTHNHTSAVWCEINQVIYDEDGEVECLETIERSEYFYIAE